jgi:hypothetical protein
MKVLLLVVLLASSFAWESFAPGEGPFDHMSDQEFSDRYLMSLKFAPSEDPPQFDVTAFENKFGIQREFDWRNTTKSNCIGPIRNQGRCGSCWAFATSGMMEDRHCIKGGYYQTFSPQFMVDCVDKTWGAEGCDGADTQTALYWLEKFGQRTDKCYPYYSGQTEAPGRCEMHSCPNREEYWIVFNVAKESVKLYNDYSNIEIAEDLIQNGPVYLSMVVFSDFKKYKRGIYIPRTTARLGTHAVKCIGWGHDPTRDYYYWICANSWGTQWGEQGFFKIYFNCHIGFKAGSLQTPDSPEENLILSE